MRPSQGSRSNLIGGNLSTSTTDNHISSMACMLDIIWNAVEDEYLTVIMYLLCSIPMRFSGKTSQMIHNVRNDERSGASSYQTTDACRGTTQSRAWGVALGASCGASARVLWRGVVKAR